MDASIFLVKEHNTAVGFKPDPRLRFWADELNTPRTGKIAPQNAKNYTKDGTRKRAVSKSSRRADAEILVRGIYRRRRAGVFSSE
jgi:hypothetical protein